MYSDGYKYWLAYKKNDTSYYRCSRYKLKCPGRCVVEDDKMRNTTPHNHQPEPDKLLVDKFRKALTHRAATETTDLYNIFWDEAIQRHSDAAMLYTYDAAESAMRKARRKQLPPTPNTIQELGDVLTQSNLFRIHSGVNKDQFYQTTLVLEDTTCLIFSHLKTLGKIGRVDEMYIDASIDVTPANPPSYCLLTAHSVHAYNSNPILYAIMTSKTQLGYAAVFAHIRENFSAHISPSVIITNFDTDMQSALAFTFPEATIKGYWFHYTDAVLKYMKYLDLQQETARGHGSSCLRMLLVLPLLPAEYIAPGLTAVRKWAEEKKILSEPMSTLCTYIEQNWLRAYGADKISIFGLPHSIYNHIQHFNNELKNLLGIPNPIIWHMLESITHIATRTFVKVNKRSKNLNQSKQPKKGQQVLDTIINNATQHWIRTPVHLRNPLQFLQISSHCINDTLYYSSLEDLKKAKKTSRTSTLNIVSSISLSSPASNSSYLNGQKFKVVTQSQSKPNRLGVNVAQGKAHQISINSNGNGEYSIQTDPPPLAFFPKVNIVQKRIVSQSQPPPLIPIARENNMNNC